MTYGNPFKHAQEKVKPSSINFYSLPFEKEDIISFYKDQLKSIQYKIEGLQLGKAKPID